MPQTFVLKEMQKLFGQVSAEMDVATKVSLPDELFGDLS